MFQLKKIKIHVLVVCLLVLVFSNKALSLCYNELRYTSKMIIGYKINGNTNQLCVCKKDNKTALTLDCAGKDLMNLKVLHPFTKNFHTDRLLRKRRHNSTRHSSTTSCGIETLKLDFQRNGLRRIGQEFHALQRQKTARKVKELDLSYNRISFIEENSFWPLENLAYLSLKYNDLYSIPRLQHMNNLLSLELQYNSKLKVIEGYKLPNNLRSLNIAALPIKHISQSLLQNLTKLRELDVSQGIGTGVMTRFINVNAFNDLQNLNSLKLSFTKWSNNIQSHTLYKSLKKLKKLEADSCTLHYLPNIENNITRQLYNQMLVELDLTNNPLVIDKVTTMNLPHLKRLKLSFTRLKTLDSTSFQNMPVLDTLKLSGLKARKFNLSCLNNHPTIRYLDISYNNLKHLPKLSPVLTHLNTKGNKLQTISANVFRNAKSLLLLDLSKQDVQNIEAFAFGKENDTEMIKLNLQDNLIRNMPGNAFYGLAKLEELNLERNQIEYIHYPLQLYSLKKLILSNNNIQNISSNIFDGMYKLEFIDIKNNNLLNFDIATGLPLLTYLNLKQNNIRQVINLTNLLHLKTLDLSNNQITNITKSCFLNCVENMEELRLKNNLIRHIENNSFDHFQNLTILDLSYNKNIEPFEIYLPLLTLQKFYLYNSNISTFPQIYLPELTLLDLKLNLIQSLGSIPVREIFPKLQELILGDNQISHIEDGILDGLNLERIDLQNNQFSCPCDGEEGSLQTYEYVKHFLANLTLYIPSLYNDIENDKIEEVPAYGCIKNRTIFQVITLLGEGPCNQTGNSILSDIQSIEVYYDESREYSGLSIVYEALGSYGYYALP